MIRHIIIEGVDGTGKTTLANDMAQWRRPNGDAPHFLLPKRRSSTSTGGPVPALDRWVETQDMIAETVSPTIFDRHPIISEMIYGPICRDRLPGRFNINDWVMKYRKRLTSHSLIVWCIPPLHIIRDNVARDPFNQMPGVVEHLDDLCSTYSFAFAHWPGPKLWYDYTKKSTGDLLTDISEMKNTEWSDTGLISG